MNNEKYNPFVYQTLQSLFNKLILQHYDPQSFCRFICGKKIVIVGFCIHFSRNFCCMRICIKLRQSNSLQFIVIFGRKLNPMSRCYVYLIHQVGISSFSPKIPFRSLSNMISLKKG